MKIKRVMIHRGAVLILLFLLLQLSTLFGVIVYFARTEINSDFMIISDCDNEIVLKTPIGRNIFYHINAGDTIVVNKRPLRLIEVVDKHGLRQVVHVEKGKSFIKADGVEFYFQGNGHVSLKETLMFLFALNYHYLWIALSVILVFVFVIVKRKAIFGFMSLIRFRFIRKIAVSHKIIGEKHIEVFQDNVGKSEYRALQIICLLFVISLFVGIGKYCLQQNESGKWRALVALEMKFSGNYVAPTLNGEYYYNKPPLFNYLLLPFVDSNNLLEFKLRSVGAFSVLLLCFAVYMVARYRLPLKQALFACMVFAFSITVYMLGSLKLSIDPFFSAIMVLLFYFNYRFASRARHLQLFIVGYFLTAVGFMTKAYPAIYFQAISMISLIFVFGNFKQYLSWKHLVGLFVFVFIIGGYSLLYSTFNDSTIWIVEVFRDVPVKLQTDSMRRFENILSFPGKSLMFYPVLFLISILFFRRNFYYILKDKCDLYFLFLIILGCLPFIIGDYYPQYIMMLIPFAVILVIKYLPLLSDLSKRDKIGILLISIFLSMPVIIFSKQNFSWMAILTAFNMAVLIIVLYLPLKKYFVFNAVFMFLIITRLSLVYIPDILYKSKSLDVKKDACELIAKLDNNKLFLYGNEQNINYATMFYLTYYYEDIITIKNDLDDKDAYYLSGSDGLPQNAVILDSISQIVHFKKNDPYARALCEDKIYLFRIKSFNY